MTEEKDKNKPLDIIDKLKLGPPAGQASSPPNRNCPACGAKGVKQAGLTHCPYCGHEFIKTR
ncbi:hypothetical protein ACFOTA_03300 [Chitinophaga sp. GCM10012297]|uniref:Uncharacterized protein n=1 Tax=Chitinophaga chungangae TaxID=2821488 RepID=A0ABS3Y959_9BACT|nr:hypothetical protein [Chitinophaga chungangae]MBO9151217.1 hypothetical protein [Chitinophaga chungangae]